MKYEELPVMWRKETDRVDVEESVIDAFELMEGNDDEKGIYKNIQ